MHSLASMCDLGYANSGGPEGIRTLDLYSAIVALSQLSYRPGARVILAGRQGIVKEEQVEEWITTQISVQEWLATALSTHLLIHSHR